MMIMLNNKILGALLAGFFAANANAYQSIDGKVTVLEATYLPNSVSFQLSAGTTICPAGTWLKWKNADQSNNKSVYATLLTAAATGKTVRLLINDGDSTCTGLYVYLMP